MIPIDPQLEAVARGDIPERYAQVVGVSIAPSGRYAVVMLTTNGGDAIEFDETVAPPEPEIVGTITRDEPG